MTEQRPFLLTGTIKHEGFCGEAIGCKTLEKQRVWVFLCIKKYTKKKKKGVDGNWLFKYYVYKQSYLSAKAGIVAYNFVRNLYT